MKIFSFILSLLLCSFIWAQNLQGYVNSAAFEALPSATVYWADQSHSSLTDTGGEFSIERSESSDQLVVSYAGFQSDTITVSPTQLYVTITLKGNELAEVEVKGRKRGTGITNDPQKIEIITAKELEKGACCDLAGCFNTEASVESVTTNIITNTKELRLLGLSGVYNQVLLEGLSQFNGLAYTYGISSIPGPFIENLFIAKGNTSVLQGYESISGQINVIYKRPEASNRLYLNTFVNTFLESQYNAYATHRWKENRSIFVGFHSKQPGLDHESDNDTFLDFPAITAYNLTGSFKLNENRVGKVGVHTGFTVRDENRTGGQTTFNPDIDKGSNTVYGQIVDYQERSAFLKLAYNASEDLQISLQSNGLVHSQNSWFGVTNYEAEQNFIESKIQAEYRYANQNNLTGGLSFRFNSIDEKIRFSDNTLGRTFAGDYETKELVPGAFLENRLSFLDDNLHLLTGLRFDYHNEHKSQLTPRALLRFSPNSSSSIRASVGSGWRHVNLFAENVAILASSRDLNIVEPLNEEKAINYGFSADYKFYTPMAEFSLASDFYHTRFLNHIMPDYDENPQLTIVRNEESTARSNSFQFDAGMLLKETLEFKISYNLLDVFHQYGSIKELMLFNSNHKIKSSVSYSPLNNRWQADINTQWYSKQRLPETSQNPIEYQISDFSDAFTVLNAQFTYRFKNFDVYIGGENLLNVRQDKPILSWEDPFGQYFDTSTSWGPTKGVEGYIGFRYKLPYKEKEKETNL